MRSIVTVLGPTSPVYDLTTVEAVNAELDLTSDTASDAEVAAQITAASRIIATECGLAEPVAFALQDVSERFHVRYHEHVEALPLSQYPVVTLTSVTVEGVAVAATDYELDYESGLLWRLNHAHWHGDIVVVYEGGYDLPTDAEPSLARACIELIRSQRTAIGSNVNVRDIWAGENRISYFGPQQMNGALPTSIANLLEPFKRRGA